MGLVIFMRDAEVFVENKLKAKDTVTHLGHPVWHNGTKTFSDHLIRERAFRPKMIISHLQRAHGLLRPLGPLARR